MKEKQTGSLLFRRAASVVGIKVDPKELPRDWLPGDYEAKVDPRLGLLGLVPVASHFDLAVHALAQLTVKQDRYYNARWAAANAQQLDLKKRIETSLQRSDELVMHGREYSPSDTIEETTSFAISSDDSISR